MSSSFVWAFDQSNASPQANWRYQTENQGTIEVIGVGSITPTKCEFWTPSGQKDDQLTKRVTKYLSKPGPLLIHFIPETKYRYLIVRTTRLEGKLTYHQANEVGCLENLDTDNANDRIDELVQVEVPDDTQEIKLFATLQTWYGPSIELPYRVGAKGQLEDLEIELGDDVTKYPKSALSGAGQSFVWWDYNILPASFSFYIGMIQTLTETRDNPKTWQKLESLHFSFFDKKGQPIVWVDGSGNARTKPKNGASDLEKAQQNQTSSKDYRKVIRPVNQTMFQHHEEYAQIMININPKQIGKVRIWKTSHRSITFSGMATDIAK